MIILKGHYSMTSKFLVLIGEFSFWISKTMETMRKVPDTEIMNSRRTLIKLHPLLTHKGKEVVIQKSETVLVHRKRSRPPGSTRYWASMQNMETEQTAFGPNI